MIRVVMRILRSPAVMPRVMRIRTFRSGLWRALRLSPSTLRSHHQRRRQQ